MRQDSTKIRGKNLDGKEITLVQTTPEQMNLFQFFLSDQNKKSYSNSTELYDLAPKYFASPKKMDTIRKDGIYLPTLERAFQYRIPKTGNYEEFRLEIRPARLKRNGQEIELYPTGREAIIEAALIKLAADGNGCFYDNQAGVQFTLYGLRQELKRRGHEMRLDAILEALTVCNRVNISITSSDGNSVLSSPIFPVLLVTNRNEWLKDPKNTKCRIIFNPLITHSINGLSFRQYNYDKWMNYEQQLTRWLHKKISHRYIYASTDKPYNILASSIIRDSGLITNTRFRDRIQAINSALEELQKNNVIIQFTKRNVMEGRKLVDARYDLTATWEFTNEMKLTNKRSSDIQEHAQLIGYALPAK